MEGLLSRFKIVDIGRSWAAIFLVDSGRIVQALSQARMRLQLCSIWHVNRMGGNIINGRPLVVAGSHETSYAAYLTIIRSGIRQPDRRRRRGSEKARN